eukprot:2739927-Amphidinium_carterae.1
MKLRCAVQTSTNSLHGKESLKTRDYNIDAELEFKKFPRFIFDDIGVYCCQAGSTWRLTRS